MTSKICTKCDGEFTWKMPYDGTKEPSGKKPCTCTPKATAPRPIVNNMPDVSKGNLSSKNDYTAEFLEEWNNIYVRAQPLISKHCGENASAKDKHIATCGLIHDYFNSKN
jgi:hypothetical protein